MRRGLSDGITVAGGTGLAAALSLAYVIYVGRVLGPVEYGEFVTGLSLLFFCRMSFSPIHAAVTRLTAECASRGALEKIRALSGTLTQRISGVAVAVLFVTALWGGPVAELLGLPSVTLLVSVLGVVYLTVLCSVPRGILRGLKRFGSYSLSMGLEAVLRIVSGVLILSWVANSTTAFFAFLIGLVAILVWTSTQVHPSLPDSTSKLVKAPAMTKIMLPLVLLMVTSGGVQNIDMLMVNVLSEPAAAGPYGAAFAITKISGAIATPFVALLLPAVSYARAESRSVTGPFLKACGGFLLLSLIPILAFAWIPDQIIETLYGSSFLQASPLILRLSLARTCSHICHMTVLVSIILGRPKPLLAYMAGLFAEILALIIWHASTSQVVAVLLIVQAGTLIVVGGIVLHTKGLART